MKTRFLITVPALIFLSACVKQNVSPAAISSSAQAQITTGDNIIPVIDFSLNPYRDTVLIRQGINPAIGFKITVSEATAYFSSALFLIKSSDASVQLTNAYFFIDSALVPTTVTISNDTITIASNFIVRKPLYPGTHQMKLIVYANGNKRSWFYVQATQQNMRIISASRFFADMRNLPLNGPVLKFR